MKNQEKWDEIVSKINDLGEELQDILESMEGDTENVETALMRLRMSVEELEEQEIPD